MRLIDADALTDNVADLYTEGEEATESDKVINNVIDIIDNAPTVEINKPDIWWNGYNTGKVIGEKERPQGEWIIVSRNCWKCPYCQELTNEGKNYCPNCGADMRGAK